AQVLVSMGAELQRVRGQVIDLLAKAGIRAGVERLSDVRSPAVERAMLAARAAAGDEPVRSADVLLGVLGVESSMAAQVMASLGISMPAVRERVAQVGVAGTSDELPEEAGGRRVTVRKEGSRVVVELDDPEVAALLAADEVLSGDDPNVDFSAIWDAVRGALDGLRRPPPL